MMQVLLTAGHGGGDVGAVANGRKEADIAVELRNMIAGKLREAGVDVVTDGAGAENQPLSSVIKMMAGKTLTVELHCNASADGTATGVECLALPGLKAKAQHLAAVTASVLRLKLRGDGGWVPQEQSARGKLAIVEHGGLLLEVFFLSNKGDLAAYDLRKELLAATIAELLAKGV